MYSILGSQADSHFSIVNQGGKSLETKEIFHQLVKSSIVQNDNTIMISNFRTAVKDTNQILNQNINPGLLIIPSELTILKNPIPGNNNAITTSTLNMRFGVNQNLNKIKKKTVNQPLRLSGGGNKDHKRGGLLDSDGGENENETKKGDYSLPIFIGRTILGMLVLEFSFSRSEGVKVRGHTSVKN